MNDVFAYRMTCKCVHFIFIYTNSFVYKRNATKSIECLRVPYIDVIDSVFFLDEMNANETKKKLGKQKHRMDSFSVPNLNRPYYYDRRLRRTYSSVRTVQTQAYLPIHANTIMYLSICRLRNCIFLFTTGNPSLLSCSSLPYNGIRHKCKRYSAPLSSHRTSCPLASKKFDRKDY